MYAKAISLLDKSSDGFLLFFRKLLLLFRRQSGCYGIPPTEGCITYCTLSVSVCLSVCVSVVINLVIGN